VCRYEIICDPCSPVMQNRRSDVKAEQSLVQVLKVSISLAAQTDAGIDPDSSCIQPVSEMLHPQFPT